MNDVFMDIPYQLEIGPINRIDTNLVDDSYEILVYVEFYHDEDEHEKPESSVDDPFERNSHFSDEIIVLQIADSNEKDRNLNRALPIHAQEMSCKSEVEVEVNSNKPAMTVITDEFQAETDGSDMTELIVDTSECSTDISDSWYDIRHDCIDNIH